ncbi:MAG TPA: phytanoyl-CoA dioxygenase family protein [Acidimicrobiales bacterium]
MDAATRQRHLDEISEVGYTVIPDVIEPRRRQELLTAVGDLEGDFCSNDFEGFATKRVYNLLVHGEQWEAIPVDPVILPVVEGVLDHGCLVSSLSSIAIHPGETPQPIHADDILIPLEKPHIPIVCNTMWALTDFTDANGATRLVPGSHLEGNPDYGGDYPTVAAEMEAGSVLVWNGSLWHGGGANTTDEIRVGIAMNYCAGFIRQQENQQLGIPRSIAAGFEPRLRELVGYSIYNGLIGHIDKGHPGALLDAATDSALVWDAT